MKATTDIKQFFTPEQLSCMARKKKEKWKQLEDREAAIWTQNQLDAEHSVCITRKYIMDSVGVSFREPPKISPGCRRTPCAHGDTLVSRYYYTQIDLRYAGRGGR